MVRVWVAGKTVWSARYARPISERFRSGASHNKALYKLPDYSYSYCNFIQGRNYRGGVILGVKTQYCHTHSCFQNEQNIWKL